MKTPLILNLAWAAVAGGAFYAGWATRPKEAADANNIGGKSGSAQSSTIGPAREVKNAVAAALVSKDATVLDFYKQFGLDTGTPLTPERMKEAMLIAIRESDPVKSQMMFARLMEELTPENAPAILSTIRENVSDRDSMRFMGMLAYKWGEVDPLAAMEKLGQGGFREGGFSKNIALTGWAAKDPDAALKWLETYDGEDKGWMSMSLLNGMARADADKATAYALTLKEGDEKSRAAETIARELIRAGGMEKASAWLAGLTDPEMKRGAFDSISQQLVRSDPAKAAELIKAHADQEYARSAVGNVAETLARTDVKKGLEFANSLTGAAQARATGEVVGQWLDANDGAQSVEAMNYVKDLPAGAAKDAGAAEIARDVVRDDPSAAVLWANSIQDAEDRSEALVDVARRWMREDRDAATAWLATSGLTPEQQQSVTQPGRGGWDGGGRGGFGPPGGFGGGRGPGGGRGGR